MVATWHMQKVNLLDKGLLRDAGWAVRSSGELFPLRLLMTQAPLLCLQPDTE